MMELLLSYPTINEQCDELYKPQKKVQMSYKSQGRKLTQILGIDPN